MKKGIRFCIRITRGISRRFSKALVRSQLKCVGDNFKCDENIKIYGGECITIGNNVTINYNSILQSCDGAEIRICDNVVMSYGVKLITGNLDMDYIHIKQDKRTHTNGPIKIASNVWIGANVIVLPGVNIPKNTIIAAGSIVTKTLEEEGCLYGGVPAKKIKIL